jgi:hypothetical protein
MAITYPRALPSYEGVVLRFSADPAAVQTPINGGLATDVAIIGQPGFRLSVDVTPLTDVEAHAWDAWLASMRGGVGTFLAYDPRRSVPLSMRDAVPMVSASPWNGNASVTAVTDIRTVSVAGLPANAVLAAGDRVSLVQTVSGVVHYGFTMLAEDVTANGSGAATLSLEPPLANGLFSTDATAVFIRALGRFRPSPQSVPPAIPALGDSFSFDAVQVF